MPEPRRLKIRGQMRWLTWVLVGIFAVTTLALAYFAVVGDATSRSPDLDRGAFRIATLVAGAFAGLMVYLARRTMVTAVVLRDEGFFLEEGREGEGRSIAWDQIASIKVRRMKGEIDLLDLGGEKLGALSTQLEELGFVLHQLVTRTRVLGAPPPLPATFWRASSAFRRVGVPLLILGAFAIGVVGWVEERTLVGFVLLGMITAAWILDYFLMVSGVGVDVRGITVRKGPRATSTAWDRLEGVALVPVQQPKGQVTVEVAFKLRGGGWQVIGAVGQDPLPILAAVRAAAPAMVIAGPSRLISTGPLSGELKEAKQGLGGFFQQLR